MIIHLAIASIEPKHAMRGEFGHCFFASTEGGLRDLVRPFNGHSLLSAHYFPQTTQGSSVENCLDQSSAAAAATATGFPLSLFLIRLDWQAQRRRPRRRARQSTHTQITLCLGGFVARKDYGCA